MIDMSGPAVSSLILLAAFCTKAVAIDCYACTSINGGDEDCEDTFSPLLTTYHLIERNCQYGYFAAKFCFKLKGKREDGTRILVRHCSDENWGRHCGKIRYKHGDQEERIDGCLESCDYNGCNSAPRSHTTSSSFVVLSLSLAMAAWTALGRLCYGLI